MSLSQEGVERIAAAADKLHEELDDKGFTDHAALMLVKAAMPALVKACTS